MYKICDIMQALDRLAPPELAARWDNPGLLLGDAQAPCGRVLAALDLTMPVVEEAAALGCGAVLTHHPFIFEAQKRVLAASYEGDLIMALARRGLAAMAAHTNWDNAAGGVNYALAEALGLRDIAPAGPPDAEILLLAGLLPEPLAAGELLELARRSLCLPVVRAAGLAADKRYRRLAVVGGAGLELWPRAMAAGCDALLSAEGKHHIGLQAAHSGFAVLDGTHFATEIIGLKRLARLLAEALPGLEVRCSGAADSWAFYGEGGRALQARNQEGILWKI